MDTHLDHCPDTLIAVQGSMEGWADFVQDIKQYYGVKMDSLSNHYHNEQKDYYLQTSAWVDTHPSQMLGPACCFKEYDLVKVTLKELAAPLQVTRYFLFCLFPPGGGVT